MDIDQAYLDAEALLEAMFTNMIGPVDPGAYRVVHRPVVVTQEMRERIWALTAEPIDHRPLELYVERFLRYKEVIDVEIVVLD